MMEKKISLHGFVVLLLCISANLFAQNRNYNDQNVRLKRINQFNQRSDQFKSFAENNKNRNKSSSIKNKILSSKFQSGEISTQNSSAEESILSSLSGKEEILSERRSVSKTYKNTDGSFTSLIGSGPIHYQKEGKWEEIDVNIKNVGLERYSYSNTENSMKSYYGGNSNVGVMSVVEDGRLVEFVNTTMYWEQNGVAVNKKINGGVSATVDDDQLFYKNLYGSISAEYKSLTGKRKLTYVIPDKQALGEIPLNADYLVFTEDIILQDGWKYELKENKVWIKNSNDQILFLYHAPEVFEEYLSADDFRSTRDKPTVLEVIQSGNKLTYILKVKKDWLLDEARVFPLGIDPTLSVYPKNETYSSGFADQSGFGGNDYLQVGFWYNDEVDGYARFDLSSIPAGSTVTAATSGIYRYGGQGTMTNRVYRAGSSNFDPRHWYAYQLLDLFDDFYYLDIFNSYTGNLATANSTTFNTINQHKTDVFNATGLANVQASLPNGYVNVIFYPSGTTFTPTAGAGNYGLFRGYSAAVAQKPYLSVTYTNACSASTSTSSDRYINNVKFLGTLNPDTTNNSVYTATGYADYKSLTNKAKQIPGGGINVYVSNVGSVAQPVSFIKAWVDWNKDNVYDPVAEKVYDSGSILTSSTTFGYIVPVGTAAGDYNIRIRTYYFDEEYDEFGYYYGPCGSRPNGETEDYSFTVIADCVAKITAVNTNPAHGYRCGAGVVTVSAAGTGTSFQWYTSEFGATAIVGATGGTYTTGSLSVGTYTYYVTSRNGTCESVKRTPVKIIVSPTPTITFGASVPSICGDVTSLIVTSSGDKEEVTLISENFETGLGVFASASLIDNGTTVNTATAWQNKTSSFIPTGAVWFPAINSGEISNRFAYSTSDVLPPSMPGYSINTTLTYSSTVINTTNFLNLTLSFDSYYSYFGTSGESLYVEVSTDGITWAPAETYTSNIGIGTRFENKIVNLSAYINQANLRLRFRYNAGWADGVAIDNVKLYGEKPLAANFSWSGDVGSIFNAANCTAAPPMSGSPSVCINPPSSEFETKEFWTVTATAILSNGCSASGTFNIPNNSKIWNTASTNWNTTNWKPNNAIPDSDKCVIVKTPLSLSDGVTGFAKNIAIQSPGSLTINSGNNLSIVDFVHNETGNANGLIVQTDGNLIQVNNSASNLGSITVQKAFTFTDSPLPANDRRQYNYVVSPVVDQNLKSIYPGNPIVISHRESSNSFINSDGAYIAGRGLAVREPSKTAVASNAITAEFKGVPFNGVLNYGLIHTSGQTNLAQRGFNLVGNPYPSNLDIETLYDANSTLITATFQFWDNRGNIQYAQQGSAYSGANYAKYNALSGTGVGSGVAATGSSGASRIPTSTVKVGTAFMIKAFETANGQNLQFDNTMRTGDPTGPGFFGKTAGAMKDRYWLTLKTPVNMEFMTAIVYFPQGSKDFGPEDSGNSGASDDVYTFAGDKKLSIQGRDPFAQNDKIDLGIKAFQAGLHTISLLNKEGVFANGQNIYLKDKQNNIITNLSQGSYTFEATAGEDSTRFEIMYEPETVLATDGKNKEQIIVYRQKNDFVIKSPKDMSRVELYDASGKLIKSLDLKSKQTVLDGSILINGIYILKIQTKDGEIYNKKILK